MVGGEAKKKKKLWLYFVNLGIVNSVSKIEII